MTDWSSNRRQHINLAPDALEKIQKEANQIQNNAEGFQQLRLLILKTISEARKTEKKLRCSESSVKDLKSQIEEDEDADREFGELDEAYVALLKEHEKVKADLAHLELLSETQAKQPEPKPNEIDGVYSYVDARLKDEIRKGRHERLRVSARITILMSVILTIGLTVLAWRMH